MKNRYILGIALIIIILAGIAFAFIPPPPANQDIGIYDSEVKYLAEQNCRECHTSGVPDRHHSLVPGGDWGCLDCHPVVTTDSVQTITMDRNCVMCHNGTAWYANPTAVNISRPHHINTQAAVDRQCNNCHGSFIDNYDDEHYIPEYNTSLVTPLADYKVNGTDRYWGGCFACHQPNETESPLIVDNHDTHHHAILGNRSGTGHQTDRTEGAQCTWCHVGDSSDLRSDGSANVLRINLTDPFGFGWDTDNRHMEIRNSTIQMQNNDSVNGTGCEKCHSVATIHNIQSDYNNTQGELGYGHIGDNWDCKGCHAFWDASSSPIQGAIIPDVTSITPGKLTTGVDTEVTIAGSNFLSGDGNYTSVVSIDGTNLTPISVTDKQIVVTVPGLTAGVHTIQVVKTGDVTDKVSKLSTLIVVTPVDVATAQLANGKITITGTGFGPQPEPLFEDLGVFIDHATGTGEDEVITTIKADIVSWTDTEIVVTADASASEQLTVQALNGEDSATIKEV
jgi:hypothetical protein